MAGLGASRVASGWVVSRDMRTRFWGAAAAVAFVALGAPGCGGGKTTTVTAPAAPLTSAKSAKDITCREVLDSTAKTRELQDAILADYQAKGLPGAAGLSIESHLEKDCGGFLKPDDHPYSTVLGDVEEEVKKDGKEEQEEGR